MNGFGASAPYKELYEKFGITAEAAADAVVKRHNALIAIGRDRDMTVRVAINGFGRIGRHILRAIIESGRKDIEVVGAQRSRPGRDQRPPAPPRLGARQVPARGEGRRRHHRRRPRPDQGDRDQGPGRAAVEGAERRHRARVHRHLHLEGEGLGASQGRRQARARLGTRRRRRPHRRLRRQRRQADEGAHRRLQRLVHHQLPRAGGA